MAPGPFLKLLAQIVVPVVAVLARALPAAYAQALQNARKSGVNAAEAAAPVFGKRISRSEALQVLNLTEAETSSPEVIQKVGPACVLPCFTQLFEVFSIFVLYLFFLQKFEKYFAANDVSKGGSFYLQSKIYRANELLTEFQNEKRAEEQAQAKDNVENKQ